MLPLLFLGRVLYSFLSLLSFWTPIRRIFGVLNDVPHSSKVLFIFLILFLFILQVAPSLSICLQVHRFFLLPVQIY